MKRKPDPAGQFLRAHRRMMKMVGEIRRDMDGRQAELNGEMSVLNSALGNRYVWLKQRLNEIQEAVTPRTCRQMVYRDLDVTFDLMANVQDYP